MMRIEPVSANEKEILASLMQLYRRDLSEYDGTLPDSAGRYAPGRYFDSYRTEPDRYPYFILENDQPTGFALVRELGSRSYSVAEFFIIRPARGAGKGSAAAMLIFNKHPGSWHIAQQQENIPAQAFWRSTIRQYTGDKY